MIVAALLLVGYLALMMLAGYLLNLGLGQTPRASAVASLLVAVSLAPVQHGVQITLDRLFCASSKPTSANSRR